MKAIGYMRVSTDEQGASGLGLEAQRAAIARAAVSLGVDGDALASVHVDQGLSGALDLEDRPGLVAAVAELGRGDVLVVAKRDRLGRDVVVVAMIERLVERKGARVVSAAGEGTDSDGPTALLMRRIVDAFAEYERLVIAARTKAALQAKRARGERAGAIPFGYRLAEDARRLELDQGEQLALARIRELRAGGLGYRAIAERLNGDGVPARGRRWHTTTIVRLVGPAAPAAGVVSGAAA